MSHLAQRRFCKKVKSLFPGHFRKVNVIDVGSLDINGNNRGFFSRSEYIGVDIVKGRNVDVVGKAHEVLPTLQAKNGEYLWHPYDKKIVQKGVFDTIISTEALEHDATWISTLEAIYDKVRKGGLIVITCAGDGREEHGTSNSKPEDSPGTNDYYLNVSNKMFSAIYHPKFFKEYFLKQVDGDLQFYGIKA